MNQRELQPEHSYFKTSSNLIKKKRFFTFTDSDTDFDEPQLHRSFSDSVSGNKFLNYENSYSKADDAEISSICLGSEFKNTLFAQSSLSNYDHKIRNKANNLRIKEWPKAKQIAVVRPKEQSVCMISDFDQNHSRLNQMKRKTIDSLLSSKKSLDEKDNNNSNHSKNLNGKLKIEDIVDRVRHPSKHSNAIFRPDISSLKDCPQYLSNSMRLCWSERAEIRPDMKQVNNMLKQLQTGL